MNDVPTTRTLLSVAVLGMLFVAAAGVLSGAPSPQQYPTPVPAQGVARVTGTVDIGNRPTVQAVQLGEWQVRLDPGIVPTQPNVPSFLRPGPYAFTWPTGARVEYNVGKVVREGWVEAAGPGGTRLWLNPSMALSIEELQ